MKDMENELFERIMQGAVDKVMITISASDLQEFAANIAEGVGLRYEEQTVSRIRAVMGDKMLYCTRKEAMEKLGIKSSATLPMWEENGYLIPCRVGGKNLYSLEDIERIKKQHGK